MQHSASKRKTGIGNHKIAGWVHVNSGGNVRFQRDTSFITVYLQQLSKAEILSKLANNVFVCTLYL